MINPTDIATAVVIVTTINTKILSPTDTGGLH